MLLGICCLIKLHVQACKLGMILLPLLFRFRTSVLDLQSEALLQLLQLLSCYN